jgi:predicted Zn-dependent protease
VRARLDRPEEARALAEEGLKELPESPGVRVALAYAAVARGDDAEARRRLAEAVEREPELAAEARGDPVLARLLG